MSMSEVKASSKVEPETLDIPLEEAKDTEKLIKNTEKYYESNAGDGTVSTDQFLHGYHLILTIASVLSCLFLTVLDSTIVVTIFNTVGNKFNAFSKVNWLTASYLLSVSVLCPTYGKISLVFGRKYTLLFGIAIFELGSLVSGLAQNMDMLIGGRVIQGIGGGCIQAMSTIILAESVPISVRSFTYSLQGISYSFASVLGPFMGGAFTSRVSWRWCFFINIPIGAVAFTLLFVSYNPPKPTGRFRDNIKRIDPLCSLLLIAGVVLVLLGATMGGNDFPWHSGAVISCFVIGGVAIPVFAYYNFYVTKYPLFASFVFKIPQIWMASSSGFLNYCFFMSDLTYITVYSQVILGHNAFRSGVDLVPLVVAATISAIILGMLIKKTRLVKPFYVFSGMIGVIASGLLTLLDKDTKLSHRVVFYILIGISSGFQIQCTIFSCQLKAPRDITSSLISVTVWIAFNRFLGGATGIIIATVIFQTTARNAIAVIMKTAPDAIKEEFHTDPSRLLNSPDLVRKLPEPLQEEVIKALMNGLRNTFIFGVCCAAGALCCCVFATNKRIPKHKDVVTKKDETMVDHPENEVNQQAQSSR